MTKKKSGKSHENEDSTNKDLTRLEDIAEFLHEEDPELESRFDLFNEDQTEDFIQSDQSLVDEKNEQETPQEVPQEELPSLPEEIFEEESIESFNFQEELNLNEEASLEENLENSENSFDAQDFSQHLNEDTFEESIDEERLHEDFEAQGPTFFSETINDDAPSEEFIVNEVIDDFKQEKFEEVKTFAQNFSYGQISSGGNPPFSLIVRNIKYAEDAEDILRLLEEYAIINDITRADTQKALELGSLLIPQISEYCAIVLAHKLRRFDCDLEMGLADEIHPSKSGEDNPRGLSKKESLRQNQMNSQKVTATSIDMKEIYFSNTPGLEGFEVVANKGVETSFIIVDEKELERLKFVQQTNRKQTPLYSLDLEDENSLSENAFLEFQESFDLLFVELSERLKLKAIKSKANALLSLNFKLAQLPIEESSLGNSSYQILCSATLAQVKKK